jgi:Mg2+/Co2+ transporter CorB
MQKKITAEQLKEALTGDFDKLMEQLVQAVNQAQPGRIIADSEEPVRDASAQFRQRVYQKALEIRQRLNEPDFSPSAD